MDNRLADEERQSIEHTLRDQFKLDAKQLAELIRLAGEEARQASGYHQFTSLINQRCDAAQKVRIVENLWRVAFADGHLDAHESHLMRKLANPVSTSAMPITSPLPAGAGGTSKLVCRRRRPS